MTPKEIRDSQYSHLDYLKKDETRMTKIMRKAETRISEIEYRLAELGREKQLLEYIITASCAGSIDAVTVLLDQYKILYQYKQPWQLCDDEKRHV